MNVRAPSLAAAALAILAALSALAPVHAASGATGTYALGPGTVFPVADAVAFHRQTWDGDRVVVLLSTEPLDQAAWTATLDPDGAATRLQDEASWIELELDPDGNWTGTRYGLRYEGGGSGGSRYDREGAQAMKATVEGSRVTGRLRADFADGSSVDLTLAAPLLVPTGDPLPAGGGEPAAAVRACNTAFAAKDLAGVQRSCEPMTAEIIDSAVRMRAEGFDMEDPWSPAGATECEVAAVAGLTVGGGVVRGDEARVEAAGAWTDDRRCSGSVHLRRADGRWRVSRSALALAFDN
jgi:hypothetical protein